MLEQRAQTRLSGGPLDDVGEWRVRLAAYVEIKLARLLQIKKRADKRERERIETEFDVQQAELERELHDPDAYFGYELGGPDE